MNSLEVERFGKLFDKERGLVMHMLCILTFKILKFFSM